MNLMIPNEISRLLRLVSLVFLTTLPSVPVLMEERLPNFPVASNPISLMIWNVQGAGSNSFAASLKELVQIHKPEVLALLETHMGGDRARQIASILKFSGHTRVDACRFSGGIWIYRHNESVTVEPIRKHE